MFDLFSSWTHCVSGGIPEAEIDTPGESLLFMLLSVFVGAGVVKFILFQKGKITIMC